MARNKLRSCFTNTYVEAKDGVTEKNVCTVIATSILTGKTFEEAHSALARHGRRMGQGAHFATSAKAIDELLPEGQTISRKSRRHDQHKRHEKTESWKDTKHMTINSISKEPELWKGRWYVQTSGHAIAVIDGEVHDHSIGSMRRIVSCYKIMD